MDETPSLFEDVEGKAFTTSEYDALVLAAFNGGLIPYPNPDDPAGEVPEALMEWLHWCEYIKTGNAILHLILAGVFVPVQRDVLDSRGGYRFTKTDIADAVMENLGVGNP